VNKVAGLVLLGFIGLGVGIVAMPRGDYRIRGGHRPALDATASASIPVGAPTASAAAVASAAAIASSAPELEPSFEDVPELADAAEVAAASASGVPALHHAPKSVTFGVVLVTYAGAQGAPRNARSKTDAEKLAAEVAELAKTDFRAAVKKGDSGSTEDAGKMYQGILEPAPEYALFSLDPEQVSGVVDTPRGFWVVRRLK
jgi:hypothetical protein